MNDDHGRGVTSRLVRPVMRDRFRAELRSRLMLEAQAVLAPRPVRSAFAFVRPAFAAGACAFVLVTGAGITAASSLPGDPLFGVKRATEEAAVALTFDEVARVQLLSELADRRLSELSEATRERPAAAPSASIEYAAAVQRFVKAVDNTVNSSQNDEQRGQVEDTVENTRAKHTVVIDSIKDKLSDDAKREVERAKDEEKRIVPNRRPDATQRPGDNENNNQQRRTATPRANETPRPLNTPRANETLRPISPPRVSAEPEPDNDNNDRKDSPKPTPRGR
jgi:hypothetical protein